VSAILENWKRGLGFPDVLVIDGHVHIGAWRHAATFRDADHAAEESVAFLDAHGVDAFCAVGGGYTRDGADYRTGNDFLLEVWRRLPERMIPFLSVNPNDARENLLTELERMHAAGVRCIKLINRYQQRYPGDGPNLMLVYEFAAEREMLVFNHAWSEEEIAKISAQFPEVDFVFGHYGGNHDAALRERANLHTNIWAMGSMGWLDRGVAAVGAGKFMMGSDGFLNPLSVGIGPVAFAKISEEDKRRVLGLNAAALLAKVGALPPALAARYGL
jgi:predicted TIM-barrel fold metal-dependent hydrolase